jgi:Pentapeptide repeats (8 copies)
MAKTAGHYVDSYVDRLHLQLSAIRLWWLLIASQPDTLCKQRYRKPPMTLGDMRDCAGGECDAALQIMKRNLLGPTFVAALLCATVLAVWLGILGPLRPDLSGLRNWQTLMAALVAVGVALIAYKAAMQKARLDREIGDREVLGNQDGVVSAIVYHQTRSNVRHPSPCQHVYSEFRVRIFTALTKPRLNRSLGAAQFAARMGLLILDVPTRWLMNLCDTIVADRGYFAAGSILAAYLAVFGLIDSKSTQEETRASLERSLFITLVSSGNAASFVAAMKDFGAIQTMKATAHPSLFKFWEWGRSYPPNQVPMHRWAQFYLPTCKKETCSLDGVDRVDLSFANLSGADLHGVDLHDAQLGDVDLTGAALDHASLDGANLSGVDLSGTKLTGATYDVRTTLPPSFDPKAARMILRTN